eukprot:TRINITY_DN7455_c0_g1_i2.p1 TRINITY_DN7455_c0_g1~~TRINITY_DN7455_c0_g1_i2.p1  ORF type:complete len:1220 (-),score=269.58 TRINITY_DN7455_c0_g1_i2:385-4044(-)
MCIRDRDDKRVVFPTEIEDCPDIIVYWADENLEERRHSFSRIKASSILDRDNPRPERLRMKEDRSLNLIEDDEFPGSIFAKIQLFSRPPQKSIKLDRRRLQTDKYEARFFLFMGRGLPPADETGACDPFVIIRCAGQSIKSQVSNSTLNPCWFEVLTMTIEIPPFKRENPPVGYSMLLYDDDNGEKERADLLGRNWIEILPQKSKYRDASGEIHEIIYNKPRWHNVIYDVTDTAQGKILIGCALIPYNLRKEIVSDSIRPKYRKGKLHVFVIGIRDIDLRDGRKPYKASVSFDISGDDYDAIKTDPMKIENGGVNINKYIDLKVDVPYNRTFCPIMDIYLLENTNYGEEIMLGIASVDLSEFLSSYYEGAPADDNFDELMADLNNLRINRPGETSQLFDPPEEVPVKINEIIVPEDENEPLMGKILPEDGEAAHPDIQGGSPPAIKPEQVQLSVVDQVKTPKATNEATPKLLDASGSPINFHQRKSVAAPKDAININPSGFMPLNELDDHEPDSKGNAGKKLTDQSMQIPSSKVQAVNQSMNGVNKSGAVDGTYPKGIIDSVKTPTALNGPGGSSQLGAKALNVSATGGVNTSKVNPKDVGSKASVKVDGPSLTIPVGPPGTIATMFGLPQTEKAPSEPPEEISVFEEGLITTFRPHRGMEFDDVTKMSMREIGAADVVPTVKAVGNEEIEEDKPKGGGFGLGSVFSVGKGLLKGLGKKGIPTYVDYDSEEGEDLDLTPEYMRDRETFPDDLEDHPMFSKKIIQTFPIKSGQTRGNQALFGGDNLNEVSEIAYVKCLFLQEKLNSDGTEITEKVGKLKKVLTKTRRFLCRLYVLKGLKITPFGSSPDNLEPYLIIKCGDRIIKDKKISKRTGINPDFYCQFDFDVRLPGSCTIRLEVWNDDPFGFDDLIGFTEIDVEDRYFNRKWMAKAKKPVESRNIMPEFSKKSVGRLQMILELLESVKMKPYDISPLKKEEYELRVVVWETMDCVIKDETEGCNDTFVRGGPKNNPDAWMETDTHYRCRAKGSFNWRMKFKLMLPFDPEEDYGAERFLVQIWDRDLTASNDLIGEVEIPLDTHNMLTKALKRKQPVKMKKKIKEKDYMETDRIWFQVFHPEVLDDKGNPVPQGRVLLSFELMPIAEAEKQANGNGRDAPNIYPVLPEPTGRLSFDIMNPCQFVKDIIGPDLYRKIWMSLCCVACTILCLYLGIVIFGQAIGKVILG